MLVLPKLPISFQNGVLVVIEKNSNPWLEHWFSKSYLFHEFQMKYFMDIEIFYKKFLKFPDIVQYQTVI